MTDADRGEYAARALAGGFDPDAVVRLARALASAGRAWCWLDGEASRDARGMSYLGVAAAVRRAEPGREAEFLAALRAEAEAVEGGLVGAGNGLGGDGGGSGDASESRAAGRGFAHGWVAVLGYEFGVALLGLDPAEDDEAPAFALRLDAVVAIDHRTGLAELRGRDEAVLDAWLAEHGGLVPPAGAPSDISSHSDRLGVESPSECRSPSEGARSGPSEGEELARGEAAWRRSDDAYRSDVDACRVAIADGEAYVLCLTDTAEAGGRVDPLELYTRLRRAGAAIRGGVVVAGDRALVSASPERFLAVDGQRVETHPIKGTRPRGATPEEDAALAAELGADPKERAENLMIVDLMRNDLSRVCAPGTVAVEGFLRVETHPHVHQLVSTVSGALRTDADAYDAIAAAFPGGSMTGAPKRRAVEILAGLERGPRGLYSGCFGWIDANGDCELAMTIRTVELRGGAALVGAGGGITADSVPERELSERDLKARPLLGSLEALDE